MVTGSRREDLAAAVRSGDFEIVSGVMPDQGGSNEGPDPHRLLEASLAACTIITVQMYANRKGWPLKSTDVTVNIVSETAAGTVITRDISFQGELDSDRVQRLFEIANKCPIHKLLDGSVSIQSKLI